MESNTVQAEPSACATGSQDRASSAKRESRFAAVITVAFLILCGLIMSRHEMWQDEIQAWMITVRSTSLADMFGNLRYDGHPGLWYLLLYPASRLSHDPVWMQVIHLSLATGAAYVFARFAPFSRLLKTLFIFGYFPLYEYGVISRNYAVGLVLIFGFAALFPARRKRLIPLCVILALLANASAYGFMLSAAFSASLAVALLLDRRADKGARLTEWRVVVAALILLVAFGAAAYTLKPAPDHGLYREWHTGFDHSRLIKVADALGIGYALVPDAFTQWRGTGKSRFLRAGQALLGAALAAFWVCAFARRRMILLMYLAASLPPLVFAYLKHLGGVRHDGHLYVILIVCLWVSCYYEEKPLRWRLGEAVSSLCARRSNHILAFILALHFACGAAAGTIDVVLPFSMSRATAEYIKANHLENMLIIGDRDCLVSPITGYLDRDMYYPKQQAFGSYTIYNQKRMHTVTEPELLSCAEEWKSARHQDIMLVLCYPLTDSECRAHNIRFLKHFGGSVDRFESYWLYIMSARKETER